MINHEETIRWIKIDTISLCFQPKWIESVYWCVGDELNYIDYNGGIIDYDGDIIDYNGDDIFREEKEETQNSQKS